ncbi:unnamed protein product [Cochlearia groenlandica]
MATYFPPLIFIAVIFFFAAAAAAANHHRETKSRFKPPQFSPLFISPHSQNSTSSSPPTRYFEVQKPPIPDILPPTATQTPCSHRILRHDFAYTYSKPPVVANYTPPSHCSSLNFSRIVLEFKSTCRGRQFDRIFGVWLDGVEILRSCTAEPRLNGIVWSVKKDVSKYHSLLMKKESQILSVYLGNLIDKIYTGVYHVDIIFHYYPSSSSSSLGGYVTPQADMIMPISKNLPLNGGLWFEIVNKNDTKYKEVLIPRNVYRAVLEVYVSFHERDEFWYGNFPNDFVKANNLSVAGNGPFREVVVSLDGEMVGAVWPFPVVFTGGINPLLWRPISAIGSFDLPSYDIDVTPFLGRLLDGKSHEIGFSVTNALNVWYVDANLHLWLDHEKEIVEGKVLEISRSSLEISSVSEFSGMNGNFTTKAKRSIALVGLVKSSHGDIITNASQELSYVNAMALGKEGNFQIIDQFIQANDHTRAKIGSREIYRAKSIKSYPFNLHTDSLEQGNNTSLEISNVTMGFNEERSQSANGRMRMFKSKLENKQQGEGVMVVKKNLVVSGYGSTKQVYRYVGSDQCYFRNISSYNYTVLYDKVETSFSSSSALLSRRSRPLIAAAFSSVLLRGEFVSVNGFSSQAMGDPNSDKELK